MRDDHVVLGEAKAVSGFTVTSIDSRLFETPRTPYADLLERLLGLALGQHDRRSQPECS